MSVYWYLNMLNIENNLTSGHQNSHKQTIRLISKLTKNRKKVHIGIRQNPEFISVVHLGLLVYQIWRV